MSEYKVRICHLYPDMLNVYSDAGNVRCLKKRLEWRGMECEVTGLSVGEELDPEAYDLFFIGSGPEFEQDVILDDALRTKRAGLAAAILAEKPLLAICSGYQLLGKYCKTRDGKIMDMLGLLDFYTEEGKERVTGNYLFTCDALDGETIVGFENHAGRTYRGEKVAAIGQVIAGTGNNGEDGTEGARYLNAFGAYCHGPMLPKNPAFADLLLSLALEKRYGSVDLPPLKDVYEKEAHRIMEERTRG